MPDTLAASIRDALTLAHPSWHSAIESGLAAMSVANPDYLDTLAQNEYLPTEGRLFAAFAQPLPAVRYVLIGEGPYPRAASATGVCFMDGCVEALWSPSGLSKQVNRATSLRNFMKMLLVAEGMLSPGKTSGEAMTAISAQTRAIGSPFIQTLAGLQENLTREGFLLLNATLVFREHVAPLKDAKAWRPFLETILATLAVRGTDAPTLVLWGKIAGELRGDAASARLPRIEAEHPYNLSFITNTAMQALFGPMRLLHARA